MNSAGGDFGVAANWSTDSVPFLNDDLTVSAFGQYLVTISDHDQANSLTFNAPQAALQENAGSLALTGTLLVNSGFLSLNEVNRIGAVRVTGGVLAFGNTGALGAGTVSMLGGELLATANETLSNALSFYPGTSSTIAAAHGKMMKPRRTSTSVAVQRWISGTAWKAIGTGDFNDDGHSDILFQNMTSGEVSIWEMNGNNVTGGRTVITDPGSSWRAVGTGDFNGDGHSVILFQNTSGQAAVWEMNGTSLVGGGAVSPNPGSGWRAVA